MAVLVTILCQHDKPLRWSKTNKAYVSMGEHSDKLCKPSTVVKDGKRLPLGSSNG